MRTADLILYNGVIYTMDHARPRAEAVAILGDRIAAVGDDSNVHAWRGARTETVDLRGRTVVPGFIDCHVHFGSYARRLRYIDLSGLGSLGEAVRRIKARADTLPAAQWLLGGGWNHNLWDIGRFPQKWDVDDVTGDHPMALNSKDGHVMWVNSVALRMAGIGKETPDPPGGEIERDALTGEPTGILKERAQELVERLIPAMDQRWLQELMKEAFTVVQRRGVTGVHNHEGAEELTAFQELVARGEMGLRVYASIPAESLDKAIALGLRSGFGNEWLRIGGVKAFCDGALGSRTADMLEPYEGAPNNRGIEVTTTEELRALVGRAAKAGIHATIHAIGDRANRRALDALEASLRAGEGPGLRHRIEHVQILHPDDLPRFAQLGVIASMQPLHCTSDMKMADEHWGRRSRWSYAWRSLLNSGARLMFGSDAPVEPLDPLLGLYAAATRQRADGTPPGGWYPEERLTVEEALRAFTADAAYGSGEENLKGSLVPGKLADLVVLSHDILREPPAKLLEARVEMTILGGRVVYALA